jgi:hypothetical protein
MSLRGAADESKQFDRVGIFDGSDELESFLADYTRITSEEACDLEVSDKDSLDVWVNKHGIWNKMEQSAIHQILGNMSPTESLCRILHLKVSADGPSYLAFKRAVHNTSTKDVVGLYQAGHRFAIVMRVSSKKSNAWQPLAGAMGLTAAVASAAAMHYRAKNKTERERLESRQRNPLGREIPKFDKIANDIEVMYGSDFYAAIRSLLEDYTSLLFKEHEDLYDEFYRPLMMRQLFKESGDSTHDDIEAQKTEIARLVAPKVGPLFWLKSEFDKFKENRQCQQKAKQQQLPERSYEDIKNLFVGIKLWADNIKDEFHRKTIFNRFDKLLRSYAVKFYMDCNFKNALIATRMVTSLTDIIDGHDEAYVKEVNELKANKFRAFWKGITDLSPSTVQTLKP